MKPFPWDMIGAIFGGLSFILTLIIEWNKLGTWRRIIIALIIGVSVYGIVLFIPTILPPQVPTPESYPTSEFIPGAQVTYQTKFDNIVNWGQQGTVDVIDNQLVIRGKSSGATHTTALSTGDGLIVLFKCSSGTSANIVVFNALGTKYIGIQIPTTNEYAVSLGYDDTWAGGAKLNGNLSFATDQWYYALIEINDGGQFYLKVWDKDNPKLLSEKTLPMGTEWKNLSWYGTINTNQYNNGQIEVAYYEEFRLSNK